MGFVIVTAEFPDTTKGMRTKIYRELEERKWKMVPELEKKNSGTWWVYFYPHVTEETALKISTKDFIECSLLYCEVKMVLQWGEHEPVFHGVKK